MAALADFTWFEAYKQQSVAKNPRVRTKVRQNEKVHAGEPPATRLLLVRPFEQRFGQQQRNQNGRLTEPT